VSVPYHGESNVFCTRVRVARHEELVRAQLGRPVQVYWICCLIRAECDNSSHPCIQGGVDDVLGADHICLHKLERIVLRRWYLLEGRSVDHDVDPVESAPEPALVANVPKKEAKSPVNQGRLHL